MESSTIFSFDFNSIAAGARGQCQLQTFMKQTGEDNREDNYINNTYCYNQFSNNVNNGSEHESTIGKSAIMHSVHDQGEAVIKTDYQ